MKQNNNKECGKWPLYGAACNTFTLCLAFLAGMALMASPLFAQANLIMDSSDDPAEDTITIYFNNPDDWEEVFIHVWRDGGSSLTSWPGMPMNEPAGESEWWYVEVADSYNMFVFNDGIVNNRYDDHRRRESTGWYDGRFWYDAEPDGQDVELQTFVLEFPDDGASLKVEGNPDDEIVISWERPTTVVDGFLRFTWKIDERGGDFSDPVAALTADNNGNANQLTLTNEAIDELLDDLGLNVGDVLEADWTVTATAGDLTQDAMAAFAIDLERGFLDEAVLDTITVYFSNPDDWEEVFIHVWEQDGPTHTSWPGMPMNEPAEGSVWWYVEVPGNFNMYIFNDGIVNNRYDDHRRWDGTGWYDGQRWYDEKPYAFLVEIEPFTLESPVDSASLLIEGNAGEEILIMWERPESNADDLLQFTWKLDERGGDFSDPVLALPADDEGNANQLTLTNEAIDDILDQLGLDIGDVLEADWTVTAQAENVTRDAESIFAVDLERGIIETEAEETISIFFSNPDDWEEVFVHVYIDGGPTFTTWPGMPMNEPEDGSAWWSVEVPAQFNYFIFNDGIVTNRYDQHRRRDTTGWYDGTSWYDEDPLQATGDIEPFALESPADGASLLLEGDADDEIVITWERPVSGNDEMLRFYWLLDDRGGDFSDPLAMISSDSSGQANEIALTLETLVRLMEGLELEVGDVLQAKWTVMARIGDTERYAERPFELELELGDVEGILGTVTIHFSNPDNWDEVFVHVWEDGGSVYTTWPGAPLNEPEEGSVWWYLEVPENFNMFIFNDGIVEGRYDDHRRRDETGWYDGLMWFDEEPGDSFNEYETIADLLAHAEDNTQGRLTSEVIVTFVAPSFRNQHFLSDSTGAVLVEDPEGLLTELKRGDGLTNFTFAVSELQGVKQLVPLARFSASSENNDLPYWKSTLKDLEYVGEPRLVKVEMVEFQRTGAFERSTNYNILDPTVDEPVVFRTHFSDSDVIGKPIPREPRNVTGIIAEFQGRAQLYAAAYEMIEPLVTYRVTFKVNMSLQKGFDPETQKVYLSGEMIDWIMPGTNSRYRLEPLNDRPHIYTLSMFVKDGFYEYKFFIVEEEPTWDMGEWAGGDNRELDVTEDMIVENVFGSTITSSDPVAEVPQNFGLDQNYPNPFNPLTQIQYQVPSHAHVSIEIFDVTGRQIATLVNEVKDAGYHVVSFDASRLASGVYIYRMQAGEHVFTRKMMLVK